MRAKLKNIFMSKLKIDLDFIANLSNKSLDQIKGGSDCPSSS